MGAQVKGVSLRGGGDAGTGIKDRIKEKVG